VPEDNPSIVLPTSILDKLADALGELEEYMIEKYSDHSPEIVKAFGVPQAPAWQLDYDGDSPCLVITILGDEKETVAFWDRSDNFVKEK